MNRLKNPKTLLMIAIVLAIIVAGKLYLPVALPHIQVPPETLFMIGGFAFPNTLLALLFADAVLIGLAFVATRNMQLVPTGWQNFFEAVVEFWHEQSISSIGEALTRRWLPLVLTVFLMIWFANYAHFLPGFDSVGWLCHPGECPGEAAHAPAAAETVHVAEAEGAAPAEAKGGTHHTLYSLKEARPLGIGLIDARVPEEEVHAAEEAGPGYAFVPFLRVATSDLNATLALALIAFIVVEFAGFRQLGAGYLTKFFNFKEGPIMLMVGLLELVSEVMRVLTFSFRLFGNIFAGQTLLFVFPFLLPLLVVLPIYGLELFVGLIQSYVFAILILAFMQQAITAHHGPDHGESHH